MYGSCTPIPRLGVQLLASNCDLRRIILPRWHSVKVKNLRNQGPFLSSAGLVVGGRNRLVTVQVVCLGGCQQVLSGIVSGHKLVYIYWQHE
jgi:hypothetical protein